MKIAMERWDLLLHCLSSAPGKSVSFSRNFTLLRKLEPLRHLRSIVLASRNIGVGHQGLVKFTAVMNMPPPMNENSYRDSVDAVRKAAQNVCQQSMRSAVENVKPFYEPDEDGVFDIGISGDGTWRRRGYSSSLE